MNPRERPTFERLHPRVEIQNRLKNQPFLYISLGGSVVSSSDKSRDEKKQIRGIGEVLKDLEMKKESIFIVVGGGVRAKSYIQVAKEKHNVKKEILDRIGIDATWKNAAHVGRIFKTNSLHGGIEDKTLLSAVNYEDFKRGMRYSVIHVFGGDEPGHTTDYVTVDAARKVHKWSESGEPPVIVNIGDKGGVYKECCDPENLIPQMTIGEYLTMMQADGLEHTPGMKAPFEPQAVRLANKEGMTVVLVDADPVNLGKLFSGRDFIGTVLFPDAK